MNTGRRWSWLSSEERRKEEEEVATNIKSNNPHLAGGEKQNQRRHAVLQVCVCVYMDTGLIYVDMYFFCFTIKGFSRFVQSVWPGGKAKNHPCRYLATHGFCRNIRSFRISGSTTCAENHRRHTVFQVCVCARVTSRS